jgi:release factor glutamine methyltransferase
VTIAAIAARLRTAGCIASDEEAIALLAAAPDAATLAAAVQRRERGEPLAWITGTVAFCGRSLHIAPGVFVPRIHTEELARRAAQLVPTNGRAIDLCTGIGAVAAHVQAQVPTATVVGVDIDPRAAACARRNGIAALVANVADPMRSSEGFDVVTAVAPYVPTGALPFLPADVQRHEPRVALDGGIDGLALVREIVAAAGRLLRAGGWLLTEVGGEQDEMLAPALADAGFDAAVPWHDDEGDLRGIAAQRASR